MGLQLLHEEVTGEIRQAAFEAHRYLGHGFLEKVYKNALDNRLRKKGLQVSRDHPISVYDEDGTNVGSYAADLVVNGCVLVELKAVRSLTDQHSAQVINYLKATGLLVGLLVNFGGPKLEVRRFVYDAARPRSPFQPGAEHARLSDTT